MPRTALVFLLLTSCGVAVMPIKRTRNAVGDLVEQKAFYFEQLTKQKQNQGFFKEHECDSLLFSGLLSASGYPVNLHLAEDNGRWFRTPEHNCYPKNSGSDISRDMIAGLLWGLYAKQDKNTAYRLYLYAANNAYRLGRGSIDRVFLTTNFQNTITLFLGLPGLVPESWIDPVKDHQRHIVVLNLLLRGEIQNFLTLDQYLVLKHLKNQMPGNALASFAVHRFTDGDQSETLNLLSNETYFPRDRLPTSKDRCQHWLWEFDINQMRTNPCKPTVTHTGGDFSFLAWLLERSTKP